MIIKDNKHRKKIMVLIELKSSGNLKIKEESIFYYVNKIF